MPRACHWDRPLAARVGFAVRAAQKAGLVSPTVASQADALLFAIRAARSADAAQSPILVAVDDHELARRVPPYVSGLRLHRSLTAGGRHTPYLGDAVRRAHDGSEAGRWRQSVLQSRNAASHAPFRSGRSAPAWLFDRPLPCEARVCLAVDLERHLARCNRPRAVVPSRPPGVWTTPVRAAWPPNLRVVADLSSSS